MEERKPLVLTEEKDGRMRCWGKLNGRTAKKVGRFWEELEMSPKVFISRFWKIHDAVMEMRIDGGKSFGLLKRKREKKKDHPS